MTASETLQTPGGDRIALVIGNSAYRNGPPLANPATDAVAIAGAFERLGFSSVERRFDLDKSGQDQALRRFTARAKSADMAVVYYAGHGMEMDGENYLLPVDAELGDASSLGFEATRLSDVMRAVEGARKFRFVILDACRDNPFRGRMHGLESTRSMASRGLAAVEPPGNTLVAYAARHGTTAKDGVKGQNSPYAAALLNRLETPNLDVRLVLGHVRDDVMAATTNQQQPFFYGTLGGHEIYLKHVAATPARPAPVGDHGELLRTLEEERDWERALRSNSVQGFEAFRSAWPDGRFAELVAGKIDEVQHALEQADWDAAERAGTPAALQSFQQAWPGGKYAAETVVKIKEALTREGGAAFKALMDGLKHKSTDTVDPAPIKDFLARFADDPNAADAQDQLLKIEASHIVKFRNDGRLAGARRYLEHFPDGLHLKEVKDFMAGAGDDRQWIKALGVTPDWSDRSWEKAAFQTYLDDWPEGRHAAEAKSRLEQLTAKQKRTDGISAVFGLAIILGGLWIAFTVASYVLPQVWSALPGSFEEARKMIADKIAPKPEPPPFNPSTNREPYTSPFSKYGPQPTLKELMDQRNKRDDLLKELNSVPQGATVKPSDFLDSASKPTAPIPGKKLELQPPPASLSHPVAPANSGATTDDLDKLRNNSSPGVRAFGETPEDFNIRMMRSQQNGPGLPARVAPPIGATR